MNLLFQSFYSFDALISQPLITRCDVDDSAVGEAVLCDDVLHDAVVAMRVDTEVRLCGSTEVDDAVEDAVNVGIAGYTMDDVIG